MNSYDPTTPCPACGYAEEEATTTCRRSAAKDANTVLVRICQRCSFEWHEKPLFNPEK